MRQYGMVWYSIQYRSEVVVINVVVLGHYVLLLLLPPHYTVLSSFMRGRDSLQIYLLRGMPYIYNPPSLVSFVAFLLLSTGFLVLNRRRLVDLVLDVDLVHVGTLFSRSDVVNLRYGVEVVELFLGEPQISIVQFGASITSITVSVVLYRHKLS